jgi:DNA repair photolyase
MHYKKYKSILSPQNGMNLFRGCTHGCIYCDSRSKCYQINHDFEDIEIKENAVQMLSETLKRKRHRAMIGTGAMTDPYMNTKETLEMTRDAIEIIEKSGFGLAIQTKSSLILRDLDRLVRINDKSKCVVQMTLTTYDEALCKIIEPNVSTTRERFEALKIFSENGIPTVVWLSPFLPFINDTEENLMGLLNYCIQAKVHGIIYFGMGLTLRDGNREYFYEQLDRHFPGMKEKYIKTFGNAYVCSSPNEKRLTAIFDATCKSNGILHDVNDVFSYMRTYEEKNAPIQLNFFD